MCYELNPKVQYFDRHKVTKVVSEQAARVKATLKKELGDKHFALTCDHWTSLAGHNYLGVTAHYITESWKLRSFTLSCNEHTGSSKADDILRKLKNAWTTYELSSDRMMGVVTDTAPVMGSFGRQLPKSVPHFYCVDHVLELTTVLHLHSLTHSLTHSLSLTCNHLQARQLSLKELHLLLSHPEVCRALKGTGTSLSLPAHINLS